MTAPTQVPSAPHPAPVNGSIPSRTPFAVIGELLDTKAAPAKAAPSKAQQKAKRRLPDMHNPAALGAIFYGGVLAVAGFGSATAAVAWLHWQIEFTVPAVMLVEVGGVYLSALADQRRRLNEQAIAARVLSTAVALGAVLLNWLGHADEPMQAGFFAGMSALGYSVWLIRSGQRRRDQLRADGMLPEPPPPYGLYRWLRHPLRTREACALFKRHPELKLYGSLEAVDLRPKIRPLLEAKLTAIHGRQEASALLALMDAANMMDKIRELIDFDSIAATVATEINAAAGKAHHNARVAAAAGVNRQTLRSKVGRSAPGQRVRRPTSETRDLYHQILIKHPGQTQEWYADKLGIEARTLRKALKDHLATPPQ